MCVFGLRTLVVGKTMESWRACRCSLLLCEFSKVHRQRDGRRSGAGGRGRIALGFAGLELGRLGRGRGRRGERRGRRRRRRQRGVALLLMLRHECMHLRHHGRLLLRAHGHDVTLQTTAIIQRKQRLHKQHSTQARKQATNKQLRHAVAILARSSPQLCSLLKSLRCSRPLFALTTVALNSAACCVANARMLGTLRGLRSK